MRTKLTAFALVISLICIGLGLFFYKWSSGSDEREMLKQQEIRQEEQAKAEQQQQEQLVLAQKEEQKRLAEQKQQAVTSSTQVEKPVATPVETQTQEVQTQPVQEQTQPVQTQPQAVVTQPVAPQQSADGSQTVMQKVDMEQFGLFKTIKTTTGTLVNKDSYLYETAIEGTHINNVVHQITVRTEANTYYQFYVTANSFESLQLNTTLEVQYRLYEYSGHTIQEVLDVKVRK